MEQQLEQQRLVQQVPGQAQALYQQPVFVSGNKVVSSRAWYNTKIVLGSLALTTDVIILGIGGGLVSEFPAWFCLVLAFPPVRRVALEL